MKTLILGMTALGLALAAAPAVAQNMQGPGATGYGAGSSPQSGGTPNTQANPSTSPNTRGLYNYNNNQTGAGGAPADNNNGNMRRRY